MPITSGTYNYGPAETLVNLAAIATELAGQTLTGDCEFIQTGNISEAAGVLFTGINHNGFKIVFRSASWGAGSPTSGYTQTFTGVVSEAVAFAAITSASAAAYFEWKELYWTLGGSANFLFSIGTTMRIRIHDILMREASATISVYAFRIQAAGANAICDLYNVKLWTTTNNSFSIGCSASGINAACRFENITAYNHFTPIYTFPGSIHASAYMKNCIGFTTVNNTQQFQTGALTVSQNASQDASATGSGSLTGLTSAAFLSISPASSDFLEIIQSSPLANAGSAPGITENNHGINGNARPQSGACSIGADEVDAVLVFILMAQRLARAAYREQEYRRQRRDYSMASFLPTFGFSVLPDSSGHVSDVVVFKRRFGLKDFDLLTKRIKAGVKL